MRLEQEVDLGVLAARMRVCGGPDGCGALFGAFVDVKYGGVERVQRCSCLPRAPEEREALWGHRDFNTAAELCYACAATLIPSGSRWSRFFCAPCHDDVLERNERNKRGGRIPVGRHSIANGLVLDLEPGHPRDEAGEALWPAAFAAQLEELSARVAHLREWRKSRARDIVRWTGCGGRVTDYLAAASSASARREAMAALGEHFSRFGVSSPQASPSSS